MTEVNIDELVRLIDGISKETNDNRGMMLAVAAMAIAAGRQSGVSKTDVLDMVGVVGDPMVLPQNDVRRRAERMAELLCEIADIH